MVFSDWIIEYLQKSFKARKGKKKYLYIFLIVNIQFHFDLWSSEFAVVVKDTDNVPGCGVLWPNL